MSGPYRMPAAVARETEPARVVECADHYGFEVRLGRFELIGDALRSGTADALTRCLSDEVDRRVRAVCSEAITVALQDAEFQALLIEKVTAAVRAALSTKDPA